jgi:hypothetical protein
MWPAAVNSAMSSGWQLCLTSICCGGDLLMMLLSVTISEWSVCQEDQTLAAATNTSTQAPSAMPSITTHWEGNFPLVPRAPPCSDENFGSLEDG